MAEFKTTTAPEAVDKLDVTTTATGQVVLSWSAGAMHALRMSATDAAFLAAELDRASREVPAHV